jgi:hypothetical protein
MNKKIIILALLSNACTLWAQGPFDSLKLIIPLRDTVHSTFSQSSFPIGLQYTDTSALYYLHTSLKVEARQVNGQWINIECPWKVTDDFPTSIDRVDRRVWLNFPYLFFLDPVTFDACDGKGCVIDIRISFVFTTEDGEDCEDCPYIRKTSNICSISLPKPTADERVQFLFFKNQFPEILEGLPWLRSIDQERYDIIEAKIPEFGPSILKDIMAYYTMERKFVTLFNLNHRVVNQEIKTVLEAEFGYLRTSKSEIVASKVTRFLDGLGLY